MDPGLVAMCCTLNFIHACLLSMRALILNKQACIKFNVQHIATNPGSIISQVPAKSPFQKFGKGSLC